MASASAIQKPATRSVRRRSGLRSGKSRWKRAARRTLHREASGSRRDRRNKPERDAAPRRSEAGDTSRRDLDCPRQRAATQFPVRCWRDAVRLFLGVCFSNAVRAASSNGVSGNGTRSRMRSSRASVGVRRTSTSARGSRGPSTPRAFVGRGRSSGSACRGRAETRRQAVRPQYSFEHGQTIVASNVIVLPGARR